MFSYDVASGWWTYLGGGTTGNEAGAYGAIGVELPGPYWPPATFGAVVARRGPYTFMFGGRPTATGFQSNELWRWNQDTLKWAFFGGDHTGVTASLPSVSVAQGMYNAANIPGARDSSSIWFVDEEHFLLFGGVGWDDIDNNNRLSDIWMYSLVQMQWMHVAGPIQGNQVGNAGTIDVPDPNTWPSARNLHQIWKPPVGSAVYIYAGFDTDGRNDLFRYYQGVWTALIPPTVGGGTYGIISNTNVANYPGRRDSFMLWSSGKYSMDFFGGYGYDDNNNS